MSEDATDAAGADGTNATNGPAWTRITLEDVHAVDFEVPIASSRAADCTTLADRYQAALESLTSEGDARQTPAWRVFHFLTAVLTMYYRPDQPNSPYGPCFQWSDGSRTAIPSDFRAHCDVLATLATRASHPVLRARLSDVAWLLDRTQGHLALAAVDAYTDVIELSERDELMHRGASEPGAFHHDAVIYLRRALQLGRAVGWEKPPVARAKAVLVRLRERAVAAMEHAAIRWLSTVDLDFAVSDPAAIGASITSVLRDSNASFFLLARVELWRLAARAYGAAKNDDAKHHALGEAAECLVVHALAQTDSATLRAHFLSNAIAALHGIPGKKARRNELRHQLIHVQASVPDEMGVFSETINLQPFIDEVLPLVETGDALDHLLLIARLGRSPVQAELEQEARRSVAEHPLLSLFGGAHLDRHGKVVARTSPAGGADRVDASVVQAQIARSEAIRRQIVMQGRVEPVLRAVRDRHFISDETFVLLLQQSPAVPDDLLGTIARGLACFVQGDRVGATYILTPLLEAILRYILQNQGDDVTKFDDATETQQDWTLSRLFQERRTELEAVLGVDLTADLDRIFLQRPGPSLRHAVAHGLLHDADPYGSDAMYGCWLLYCLCVIPLIRHTAALRAALGGALA